jgi:hypothetical protein
MVGCQGGVFLFGLVNEIDYAPKKLKIKLAMLGIHVHNLVVRTWKEFYFHVVTKTFML